MIIKITRGERGPTTVIAQPPASPEEASFKSVLRRFLFSIFHVTLMIIIHGCDLLSNSLKS